MFLFFTKFNHKVSLVNYLALIGVIRNQSFYSEIRCLFSAKIENEMINTKENKSKMYATISAINV